MSIRPKKAEFRQFLDDLDLQLPFDEDSVLRDPLLADKLHVATFGLLRQVAIIVTKAAELAIYDGSPNLMEHHLHQAVELLPGTLEATLMSSDSKAKKRKAVTNPFKAPVLPDAPKVRQRGGYDG